MKHLKIYTRAILSIFLAIIITIPASALTEEQYNMFNVNGIYYWNPGGNSVCIIGPGSYSGDESAGLSTQQAGFVDTYHDIAAQLSVEYGIPWEAVMAQGILESAAGTSKFAIERNNFFGIAAYDSDTNQARYYPTPMAGWRGYYENIRVTRTYRDHGIFQEPNITNPFSYIQAAKDAGYATDPNYVSKVSKLIVAVINRAQEKGWQTSDQLAIEHPEMLTNAANNVSGSSNNTPTLGNNTSSTGSLCLTIDGSGSDSHLGTGINQTAVSLSWPDRTHSTDDPKPEYKQALKDTGVDKMGDQWSMKGASCDAFVATVMRASGADPNFPCCGAARLKQYLDSHPDLYEKVGNAGSLNSEDMMPGDIRSSSGHIEIYVQLEDGSFAIASASHGDRTADHAARFYKDSKFDVYRKK